jgi:hypothetical protein
LRAKRRRIESRLAKADRVLREMEAGCSLHLTHATSGSVWRLSNGRPVSDSVANLVVASGSITGVGDCLFRDMRSQTFRWWRDAY